MSWKKMRFFLPVLALLIVAIAWLPFALKINFWGIDFSAGVQVLWSNFDGPNYLIIAKTFYDKSLIGRTFSNPLPLEYYPAHWPLYPAMIALADFFLPGPWAMLLVSMLGLVVFYWVLVEFLKTFGVSKQQALAIGLTSLILPARWLALRSVGSPEPWFLSFVLLSLISYKNKKIFASGYLGGTSSGN